MPYDFNPLVKEQFDYYKDSSIPVAATAPAGATEGQQYINSGDNTIYIYYSGSWQSTGITLTPAALEYLLLETGDFFLLETGDKLALG